LQNQHSVQLESDGISLAAVVHLPKRIPAPVIVCCHGLLSLKDSAKYIAIGEEMTAAGFSVLRFDFSGCGESAARAGETLIEGRMRDLGIALDFASGQSWSDGRIGLLGSSLGGYLSLLAANANPDRIHAAACWASPFDVSGIHPGANAMEQLRNLFPGGFHLGEPHNLNELNQASRVLLIHGQQDQVVNWKQSIQIYDRLKDPKELILMRTADHQFLDESWRKAAILASLDWFLQYFPMDSDIS
jgi:uncharacterized protein